MTQVQSLEVEIENAWLRLGLIPSQLFLTPSRRIVKRPARGVQDGFIEIGTFTQAIPLSSFREAVFYVFEGGK